MPATTLPPTAHASPGRASARDVLRFDLPASLVVFLVAVPLSLGIAVASGAPVQAGLISAGIGGIVAGLLGGSQLQVSGPAAGMVVVVAGLASTYSWQTVCAITLAAGLLQIGLGLLGAGRFARAIPPAVVHGMLAGIGISIVLSQAHVLLGHKGAAHPLENLLALPGHIADLRPTAALVGLGTLALLLLWERLPAKARLIPGPLVAIALVTLVSQALRLDVARPDLPDSIVPSSFVPRAEGIGITDFLIAAATVGILASIESLLSAVAVDRLHTGPRVQLRRELTGQGAANIACGALGGLPVTGVIVRSSTNAMAGGRSRASAILHGVWVIVFAVFLASAIEAIPLAALAGLLVHMGSKLVNRAHIRELRRHDDLWPYLATLGGVLLLDLVQGVLVGIVVAFALLRQRANWSRVETVEEDGHHVVRVHGAVGFIAVPALAKALAAVPPGADVHLRLDVDYLDHAATMTLADWIDDHRASGGTVIFDEAGEPWLSRSREGEPFVRRISRPGGSRRPRAWWQRHSAEQPESVVAGVEEYHANRGNEAHTLRQLAHGQSPTSLFITCCDSRIMPDLITSSGPGDLFIARSIGNVVPTWAPGDVTPESGTAVAAAVEYAVTVLGVKEIVVCGHSGCGAMAGLVTGLPEGMPALEHWLRATANDLAPALMRARAGEITADDVARENVALQIRHLREHPAVQGAPHLGFVGLFFDIATATVEVVHHSEPAHA